MIPRTQQNHIQVRQKQSIFLAGYTILLTLVLKNMLLDIINRDLNEHLASLCEKSSVILMENKQRKKYFRHNLFFLPQQQFICT